MTTSTADIEREYKTVQKLILEIKSQLEQIEGVQHQEKYNGKYGSTGSEHFQGTTPRARRAYQMEEIEGGMVSPSAIDGQVQQTKILELQAQLSANINKLSRAERSIRDMVAHLPLNKRDHWKREIENVTDESRFLRRSVDKYMRTIHDSERDRELLMGSYKGSTNDEAARTHEERMGELHKQRASMSRSLQVIEQMKDVGTNVMEMLSEQSDTLRGVHRKVIDMGISMGVVGSTLRLIERRHKMDKWIVYIGMVLIMALLIFVFWWRFL
jgi:Golgi SNAP receptor complex protein 2